MKSKIKRTIAILLAVCFLVSLTSTAVSAGYGEGYGKNYMKGAYNGRGINFNFNINSEHPNTVTKSGYVVVNALKAPIAAFSASSTSGNVPLKVQFTDESTGSPTLWKWSFGDATYSSAKNPVHKYSKAEKYTVSF